MSGVLYVKVFGLKTWNLKRKNKCSHLRRWIQSFLLKEAPQERWVWVKAEGNSSSSFHIVQSHQELNFEFPSCPSLPVVLEVVIWVLVSEGPLSTLTCWREELGIPPSRRLLLLFLLLVHFSEMWDVFVFHSVWLISGFQGPFHNGFEICMCLFCKWHRNCFFSILILLTWSCVCAWE